MIGVYGYGLRLYSTVPDINSEVATKVREQLKLRRNENAMTSFVKVQHDNTHNCRRIKTARLIALAVVIREVSDGGGGDRALNKLQMRIAG